MTSKQDKADERNRTLSRKMSAQAALRLLTQSFATEFTPALASFLTSDAPEGAHKTRVALRRLRAVLTGFSPLIARKRLDHVQRQNRMYFRLIGTVRDADVVQGHLTDPAAVAKAAQTAKSLRKSVRAKVTEKGISRFISDLTRLLHGKGWRKSSAKARRAAKAPISLLATKALQKAYRACLQTPLDLVGRPAADLHELRKKLKALRYLCLFAAPLWPGPAQAQFLATLGDLQDELGRLHDAQLAQATGQARIGDPSVLLAQALWQTLVRDGPWWSQNE